LELSSKKTNSKEAGYKVEQFLEDLQKISEEHRKAFEESEAEFQRYEDLPGITPEPMRPERVLEEP